jgi:hypothetical protein
MKKLLLLFLLLSSPAWAATYYLSNNGTAANKEAASGPCTTAANCMNRAVYAGETFANGDVIVHCSTPLGGFGDDIIGVIFGIYADVSVILSIPSSSNLLLVGGDNILLVSGDSLLRVE